tara:strand:+ start:515 stop:691 length:177 start_codon:yes stop_codon:yes gene_type:complete
MVEKEFVARGAETGNVVSDKGEIGSRGECPGEWNLGRITGVVREKPALECYRLSSGVE